MLLFALFIVFIGLCYHQYNENFRYDSHFSKNDSISRLVNRRLCVNSSFINSKLQSNFCSNASNLNNSHFNHNIFINLLLILSGDININPGPTIKFPCGTYSNDVKEFTDCICCDNCNIWFHKSCLDISLATFDH